MSDDQNAGSETAPNVEEDYVLPQQQFVIGVGGCGNNLIDAILLRKSSEENNDHMPGNMPEIRWNQIMLGQAMINSHLAELADSYYFTELKSQKEGKAAELYAFHQHGAGKDWKKAKNMLLDHFDSSLSWDSLWGEDLQTSHLEKASSIWLLHSAVGGTGAGATPLFASALRDSLTSHHKTPIISFPVLNDSRDLMQGRNTLVGLSRLSEKVEAIIPVSNEQLRTLPTENMFDIKYKDDNILFEKENRAITTFLELVGGCLTSDQDFGEFIDITDVFMPIKQYYPPDKETPAPILAPAMEKLTESDLGDYLEMAISSLFEDGKLVDFDPSTAWGVTLVLCGPPDQMENIIHKTRHHQLSDRVSEYIDQGEEQSIEPFVRTYHTALSGLDDVWMIALVANPEIQEISRAYEVAEHHKNSNTTLGENVENNWPLIDDLVEVLQTEPSGLID